ncbi:uncharacterized protein LOC129197508 [Grus americana]|uniref:uncharacterized protein LOC129197508 n=1 Tax=Grus americana TaxID=9117 RepID=UPI002407CDCC|nr:uncharacterized protein LOC129197508 [Grus americana]
MAARGLLAPTGLLWLCLAPAALLRLHQPQPVLTVENGDAVEIVCEASEAMEHEANVFWYQRDGRDGPKLLLDCESRNKSRFSCEFKRHSASATLHIDHARPNDTGLYLCAYKKFSYLHFGNGTTLLVGDSWMGRSWVMVLAPRGAPQGPPGPVCAVGDTAGPVLVSWPGGPGRVLGLGGGTRLLVIPMGTETGTGELCQMRFNASGPPIQRSVELFRAAGSFTTLNTSVLAGIMVVLLLLNICLAIRCPPLSPALLSITLSPLHPRSPSIPDPSPSLIPLRHQPGTTEPPAPREDEEELQYAQLRFAAPARRTP